MTDHSPHAATRGDGDMQETTKILIGIIPGIIIVIIVAAILTFSVTTTTGVSGESLPYMTHYNFALPDGEAVTIGSSRIAVMAYNDSIRTNVDGNPEDLIVGQTRVINSRHAKITALGIPLYDADFQFTLQYTGLDRHER